MVGETPISQRKAPWPVFIRDMEEHCIHCNT